MPEKTITLRTAIARALFLLDYNHQGEESWETARLDGNNDRNRAFEQADAVLAVLADLPESVIERAARWMYDEYTALMPDSWEWDEFGREEWRVDARDVLRAAFGGEQSDG